MEEEKRPKKENGTRISDEFQAASDAFLDEVEKEMKTRWKKTDRLTVLKHLDGIRAAISGNGHHKIPDLGYTLEASNMEKLQEAGFTVYRIDEKNLLLEKMVSSLEWEIVDQYEDKQSLKAAFEELLLNPTNLRGN